MGSSILGPWQPMTLDDAVAAFRRVPVRWWVCGGYALELHVDRTWRSHDDIDIGVLRGDLPRLRTVFVQWEIHVAAGGVLSSWDGHEPRLDRSENNLWCRRGPRAPWSLDVTVGDGDVRQWVYRRDPTIQVPWSEAVLHSASGVPYLAPELQLLFKSSRPRPKDTVDAAEVIPHLEPARRRRLAALLPPAHPWRRKLDR
jgi:hypothetical protein